MIPDRRDMKLLRLAGKYRWLPFDKLGKFGFESISEDALMLSKFGLMGISRNRQYIKPTPRGYSLLREGGYDCNVAAKRPFANSTTLRRRLETSEIMLTALRAGIDALQDDIDALRNQPVFFPAFAFRTTETNMMGNCTCSGFGHWGNTAYMLHYVSPESKGMFQTNELSVFHNLSSVFSSRLTEPKAMIFAGNSYKQVYKQVVSPILSKRHGVRNFTDFADVYKRTELPIHLLSCDEDGARQLALMRQSDYKSRIAKAASFGDGFKPYDPTFPEADGSLNGNPFIVAADMDIRRVARVCTFARGVGRPEIMIAAFPNQIDNFLVEVFPRDGVITHLYLEQPILDAAFGKDFSMYSMEDTVSTEGGEPDA